MPVTRLISRTSSGKTASMVPLFEWLERQPSQTPNSLPLGSAPAGADSSTSSNYVSVLTKANEAFKSPRESLKSGGIVAGTTVKQP